jgi:hypothetical protein
MFNLFCHKGNANQNTILVTPQSEWLEKEKKQQMLARMWGNERTLIHCWWTCN